MWKLLAFYRIFNFGKVVNNSINGWQIYLDNESVNILTKKWHSKDYLKQKHLNKITVFNDQL